MPRLPPPHNPGPYRGETYRPKPGDKLKLVFPPIDYSAIEARLADMLGWDRSPSNYSALDAAISAQYVARPFPPDPAALPTQAQIRARANGFTPRR